MTVPSGIPAATPAPHPPGHSFLRTAATGMFHGAVRVITTSRPVAYARKTAGAWRSSIVTKTQETLQGPIRLGRTFRLQSLDIPGESSAVKANRIATRRLIIQTIADRTPLSFLPSTSVFPEESKEIILAPLPPSNIAEVVPLEISEPNSPQTPFHSLQIAPSEMPSENLEEANLSSMQTDIQFALFATHLRIQSTCNILHWGSGKKLDKRIITKIIADSKENPNLSLWTIYKQNVWSELSFFQKIGVKIVFFFTYAIANNLTPKLIEGCTKNVLKNFRHVYINNSNGDNELNRKNIKHLIKWGLKPLGEFLASLSTAVKNANGNEAALQEQITIEMNKLCPILIKSLCSKSSRIAVDLFYSPVHFRFLSKPLNWIIKGIIKIIVLPKILKNIALNISENALKNNDRIKLGIMKIFRMQFLKIHENLQNEDKAEPFRFRECSESLPKIAENLMIVLGSKNKYSLHAAAMHSGICKTFEIGLGFLFDGEKMEEIFSGILTIANSTFSPENENQDIKKDVEKETKALKNISNEVFQQIIKEEIEKKLASNQPLPSEIQAIFTDAQKILQDFFRMQELLRSVQQNLTSSSHYPTQKNSITSQICSANQLIEELRGRLLEHERDIASKAEQEGLKAKLAPIWQLVDLFSESLEKLVEAQKIHIEKASAVYFLEKTLAHCEEIELSLLPEVNDPHSAWKSIQAIEQDAKKWKSKAGRLLIKALLESIKELDETAPVADKLGLLIKRGSASDRLFQRTYKRPAEFNTAVEVERIKALLSDLPPENGREILDLIQLMEKPPLNFSSWDNLKNLILPQIPQSPDGSSCRELFASQMDALFKPLMGGRFDPYVWQYRKMAFQTPLSEETTIPLLDQIHQFLAAPTNTALQKAYNIRFEQLTADLPPSKKSELSQIVENCVKFSRLGSRAFTEGQERGEISVLLRSMPDTDKNKNRIITFLKKLPRTPDWVLLQVYLLKNFPEKSELIKNFIAVAETLSPKQPDFDQKWESEIQKLEMDNSHPFFQKIAEIKSVFQVKNTTPELFAEAYWDYFETIVKGAQISYAERATSAREKIPSVLAELYKHARNQLPLEKELQKDFHKKMTENLQAMEETLAKIQGLTAALKPEQSSNPTNLFTVAGAGLGVVAAAGAAAFFSAPLAAGALIGAIGGGFVGRNSKGIADAYGKNVVLGEVQDMLTKAIEQTENPDIHKAIIYKVLESFVAFNKK